MRGDEVRHRAGQACKRHALVVDGAAAADVIEGRRAAESNGHTTWRSRRGAPPERRASADGAGSCLIGHPSTRRPWRNIVAPPGKWYEWQESYFDLILARCP